MNEAIIVEAELVPGKITGSQSNLRPVWVRILQAIGMLVGLGAAGWVGWVGGILMFMFSLDGANSSDLPDWLDWFILVGWPSTIVLFAVLPSLLLAFGLKWKWILGCLVSAGALSVAVYLVGVVTVFSAVMK